MIIKAKSYKLKVYPTMRRANSGFTLIELIIYLAIVSTFAVSIILWSLSVGDLGARSRAGALVNASGRFALEIITRDIEQATAITTPTLNATSSSLVLVNNLGQTVTTNLNQGQLVRTITGSPTLEITSTSSLQVANFVVGRVTGLWAERDSLTLHLTLDAPPAPPRTLTSVVNRRH